MTRFLKRYLPGLMAGVCGLLLLPWILGVPGNPTRQDTVAWTLGLMTMIAYLVLYQAVRSSQAHRFFKRPLIRLRLDGGLLFAAVIVAPILCGTLLFLVFGAS